MVSTVSGPMEGASGECLAGRRDALIAGGFSGLVDCSNEHSTFNLAGTTDSGFTIYDYRYRFMAAAVMHGGQRLVIFKGADYVGQYSLSPPLYSDVSVRGSRVIVQTNDPSQEEADLDFSNGRPPRAFIDGYVLDLYR